jgi:hypothetical protein
MGFEKIHWPLSIGLPFIAGTLMPIGGQRSSTVLAQSQQAKPPKYLEVDYMKVQPGKHSDYVRVEHEIWKPLHQERIGKGELRSWGLYGLRGVAYAQAAEPKTARRNLGRQKYEFRTWGGGSGADAYRRRQ